MNEYFKRLVSNNFLLRTIKTNKYVIEYCSSALQGSLTNTNSVQRDIDAEKVEFKLGRKLAQKKLIEMLDIKELKALNIVTTHKKFCETPPAFISKNFDLCRSNKLNKSVVLRYPYILLEQELSEKIKKLQILCINLNRSIPLIKLSLQRLHFMSLRKDETVTRIHDLCRVLNVTQNKSCEILADKPFFLTLDLKHMEEFLKLFTENGLSREDIVKDLWIFKYSNSFVTDRLKCIKEHKVVNIKSWMLHCPEDTLFRHIKRESDNRDILGENSVAEYLSERLKCSETVAKNLIKKHPALQSKNLIKMNEMIDFLFNQGFTPSHICKVPKVLLHSTMTAQNRLKELTTLGKKPDSLYVFTKSQKQYMQHVENLTKNKLKTV